jgi:phage major head subunit gpT-like protein
MGAQLLSSRAIIGKFYEVLAQNAGLTWKDLISMYITSDQDSETYKWLGMIPQMREWVGGRNAKGFSTNGLTIANKHFEATIEVFKREMRLDKTGQVMIRIAELADRTNAHWASLLSTLIINGESVVCYDGHYFFDTTHAEDSSGTQSNLLSKDISDWPTGVHGTAAAPSVGEMAYTILYAIAGIMGFKDGQGEPFNETANNFLIMGPVSLMPAITGAVSNQFLASGETNPLVSATNSFRVSAVINPRLTWTTKIAVFRTDGRAKPFICQEEQPVELKAIAEGSELEFREDKHQYGVDTWRNVGYGFWQHACMVSMS